jgi:SanA protein
VSVRRLRLVLVPIAVLLLVPVAANAVVLLDARGETASSLEAVPHADAALVLGAQVLPDGHPSAMTRSGRCGGRS